MVVSVIMDWSVWRLCKTVSVCFGYITIYFVCLMCYRRCRCLCDEIVMRLYACSGSIKRINQCDVLSCVECYCVPVFGVSMCLIGECVGGS